jgi:hypothetical protein
MPSTLLDAQQTTRQSATGTVPDTVDLRVDAGSRIGLVGQRLHGSSRPYSSISHPLNVAGRGP